MEPLADAEKAKHRQENRAQKQKILSIIAEKQDAALQRKSADDLTAMLAALED